MAPAAPVERRWTGSTCLPPFYSQRGPPEVTTRVLQDDMRWRSPVIGLRAHRAHHRRARRAWTGTVPPVIMNLLSRTHARRQPLDQLGINGGSSVGTWAGPRTDDPCRTRSGR